MSGPAAASAPRVALACLWVAALVVALCTVEAYFWKLDPEGYPLLLPADRSAVYPTVVAIYSGTIGPILLALFFKPFRRTLKPDHGRKLARLSIALTLIYNLVVVYLLAQGLWQQSLTIDAIVDQAKLAAILLGFLVVPVNAFYFGLRPASADG